MKKLNSVIEYVLNFIKEILMKKIFGIMSLCMIIPAFASQVSNAEPWYFQICTTYDGGKTWINGGDVKPNTADTFNAAADAVAVGKIGDCNYVGSSWTNHKQDVNIVNWHNNRGLETVQQFHNGAAMIFWQTSEPFTKQTQDFGLDSVCLYDGNVTYSDPANCWI